MVKKNDTDIKVKSATAGAGLGIVGVIVAIALAIGGWLWFNDKKDTPESIKEDVVDIFKGNGSSAPESTPASAPN